MKTNNYTRQDLIKEITRRSGSSVYVMLGGRPAGKYIACARCNHVTVRVEKNRYGDGMENHINWVAEVWTGICQSKGCYYLNIWIELIDQDELDRENRRLLISLCDQELKQLETNRDDRCQEKSS